MKLLPSIEEIVLENEHSPIPLTPEQLAETHRRKIVSVNRTYARLRRLGKIPDKHKRKAIKQYTEEDVAELATMDVVDKTMRLRILSNIAKSGNDNIRISAIKALEDLDRISGANIGPPPPSNDEERITRLSRLMVAVGRPLADAAMAKAFGGNNELPQTEGSPQHP